MSDFKVVVDDKRRAMIELDDGMVNLLVSNNGCQYSAATMYSKEVVVAARDVLNQYLESLEKQI